MSDEIDGLPGQAVIVHVTVSISSKTSIPASDRQLAPLYCGAGLLHVRLRDIVPLPQVAEQMLKEDQGPHPPFTVKQRFSKTLKGVSSRFNFLFSV